MKTNVKTILIIFLGLLTLGFAFNTAEAISVIPVHGTIEEFTQDWLADRCLVTVELDVNVSDSPVIINDVFLYSDVIANKGTFRFSGEGVWDFGGGNTLTATYSGVFTSRSEVTDVIYNITGGTGLYEDAGGSIQLHLFEGEEPTGQVHGQIKLP